MERRKRKGLPQLAPRCQGLWGLAATVLLLIHLFAPPGACEEQELVLGNLRIPKPYGYINDFAETMSARQEAELEDICRRIDRATGAQMVVVTIPDLADESSSDVRTRLFEAWQIGRKNDNRGLLILHALEERRIEVEVGYDLEPVITDSRVGAILDREALPAFRGGKFYEGYHNTIAAFYELARGDASARPGDDAYRSGAAPSGGQGGSKKFPLKTLLMAPIFLYLLIRHPRLLIFMLLSGMGGRRGGSAGGGSFGGGFGGFGGGMSGGGGAGRSY